MCMVAYNVRDCTLIMVKPLLSSFQINSFTNLIPILMDGAAILHTIAQSFS